MEGISNPKNSSDEVNDEAKTSQENHKGELAEKDIHEEIEGNVYQILRRGHVLYGLGELRSGTYLSEQ